MLHLHVVFALISSPLLPEGVRGTDKPPVAQLHLYLIFTLVQIATETEQRGRTFSISEALDQSATHNSFNTPWRLHSAM